MPGRRLWDRVGFVWGALLVGMTTLTSAAERPGEGIDFLLLVDVSRSMVQSTNPASVENAVKDGTDPERIRWDATRLLLDLLGPADRLMVRRFNHGTPPIYNRGGVDQDDDASLTFLKEKDFFQPWFTDFKQGLVPLSPQRRGELEAEIAGFNRTDDDILDQKRVGYLDVGGTQIVTALERMAGPLRTSTRPLHVIVLTDGRDDHYADLRDNDVLRRRLQFYLGESTEARAPGVKVPIHCIGLNLKGEDSGANPQAADQARDLLRRISKLSGGTFEEVDDSSGLMRFFQCLTRQLRRFWVEEIVIPPGASEHQERTLVANGLSELTVLSYQQPMARNRKYAIEPTTVEPAREWIGLKPLVHSAPEPEPVRMGKPRPGQTEGTLYRCYYYGPTVESDGTLGSSPFRRFQPDDQVQLKLTVPSSQTEQRLVLFKGTTQPLFELVSPSAGARFSRYEKLVVRVAMQSRAHFSPDNFQLTATVHPAGARKLAGDELGRSIESCSAFVGTGDSGQPTAGSIPLRFVESGAAGYFEGELLLSQLARGEGALDDYEVRVSAFGLPEPSHALSRNRYELLPRLFEVENAVQLAAVEPVELSTDPGGESREFLVRTTVPTAGEILLDVAFEPPARRADETLLPASHFKIEYPGTPGALRLTEGQARVRVALTDPRPTPGRPYLPGSFRFTHPAGVHMEPLSIPLKLRLDLARVQFQGVTELDAKSRVTVSEPITVLLDPKGRIKSSATKDPVTVRLKFLGPVDPERKDGSDFDENELWLQKEGETSRTREIQLKVGDAEHPGEAFRIHMEPQGSKTPMKYRCRLEVEGDWIDSTQVEFDLNKDAAAIESDVSSLRLAIGRGLSRRVRFQSWLNGVPGEKASVQFDKVRSGGPLLFLRGSEPNAGHRFLVECPDAITPVVLHARPDDGGERPTEVNVEISVPEDTPYGLYQKDLVLVGPNVTSKTIHFEIAVNGLELDVQRTARPSTNPAEQWEQVESKRVIQLLRSPMKRSFRIRTGLGLPLEPSDLDVQVQGAFQDIDGDSVSGKVRVSEIELAEDGRTGQFVVEFPPTSNRNSTGQPYLLHLKVSPRQTTQKKPGDELYVKDVPFEFQVHFLDPREILEVRDLPKP